MEIDNFRLKKKFSQTVRQVCLATNEYSET